MILCPYHLGYIKDPNYTPGSGYLCPECKTSIYRDYVEKKEIPRTTVGLVGFSGHGKTCYLTSLFYLFGILQQKQEGLTWFTLDENTSTIMHKHIIAFKEHGKLPQSTPENFPHPALMQFEEIPYYKNYFLSFYDTAGAVFEDEEKIIHTGKFVANCKVVIFVISINDCGENLGSEMHRLLNIYIRGVYDKLHINLKTKQHIIVILSKADEIDLPEKLSGFLTEGFYEWYLVKEPLAEKKIIKEKLNELKNYSKSIEDWLTNDKQCAGFVNLAKRNFKSVEYTIVSSLGAAPNGDRLQTKLKASDPKRVLDAFLWILEKTRPKSIWEILFRR